MVYEYCWIKRLPGQRKLQILQARSSHIIPVHQMNSLRNWNYHIDRKSREALTHPYRYGFLTPPDMTRFSSTRRIIMVWTFDQCTIRWICEIKFDENRWKSRTRGMREVRLLTTQIRAMASTAAFAPSFAISSLSLLCSRPKSEWTDETYGWT